MKKILTGVTAISFLTLPLLVIAQAPPETVPNFGATDFLNALENLINWLFSILIIVAVLFIIIAAYNFVTAQGDPDKVAKARNFILYALVGVAVAVASRGLVALVRLIMGA
jgi:Type IV secretion system pilin/Family of unknown function (DUF6112)